MNLGNTIRLQMLAHAKDSKSVNMKMERHGLPITIEHPRGSMRVLHDDQGNVVYKKHQFNHYGFFQGTTGRDGDEVDCIVGPMENADTIYIVHMIDLGPDKNEREDEDKAMVGFGSAEAAKQAFLLQYPKSFFGGMTVLPVETFKKQMAQASRPYCRKKITAGGPGSGPQGGQSKHFNYGYAGALDDKVFGKVRSGEDIDRLAHGYASKMTHAKKAGTPEHTAIKTEYANGYKAGLQHPDELAASALRQLRAGLCEKVTGNIAVHGWCRLWKSK